MPDTSLHLLRARRLLRARFATATLLAVIAGWPGLTRAQTAEAAAPQPGSGATGPTQTDAATPEPAPGPSAEAVPPRAAATTGVVPEATPAPATDPERAPDFVPPVQVERWYGWQTLIADLASVGLVATGLAIVALGEGEPWGWAPASVGLAGFVAASPLVHLVHHNGWALGSVLIRSAAVGLMVGGAVDTVNCVADDESSSSCWGGGPALMIIGVTGAAVVTVVDAVMARETREQPRVAIAPWANPQARSGGLQLAARW